MYEVNKVSVTLDTEQFEKAIEKANELVEIINRVKTLSKDLADIMEDLDFKPTIVNQTINNFSGGKVEKENERV
jgi:hypothetical protein